MYRELQVTNDGSHTVIIPDMDLTYHSHHGAIQESMHVYIEAGLDMCIRHNPNTTLSVFEIGFGTGLNALLTLIRAEELQQKIKYETIEPFPIGNDMVAALNYCTTLNRKDTAPFFLSLHTSEWETEINISPFFTFKKIRKSLIGFEEGKNYHLIYFDAFSPTVQPELWTAVIFSQLFSMMNEGGILVTYCSKSVIRKNLVSVGFDVKKIQGPRGKREMVLAFKPALP